MTAPLTTLVPDDALVHTVAAEAAAAGLHLICNGRRSVISPIVPPGWFKIAVQIDPQPTQEEAPPCAA